MDIRLLCLLTSGLLIQLASGSQSPLPKNSSSNNSRDGYLMSMFEVVLTTMENKLRRVENLDRAVQQIIMKMDALERRMMNHTEVVISKLDQAGSLISRMDRLAASLDAAQNLCGSQQDTEGDLNSDDLSVEASIRRPRIWSEPESESGSRRMVVRKVGNPRARKEMDEVKQVVSGMDRRLGFHINIVSENLGKVTSMVEEMHNAIIDDDGTDDDSDVDSLSTTPANPLSRQQLRTQGKRTKLDKLLIKIKPLLGVKERVDEVRGMLAGTKTSVDHLVPKSEELLNQTQRQERAISHIHSDLNEKTNAIIRELSEVERELSKAKQSIAAMETFGDERRDDPDFEVDEGEHLATAESFLTSTTSLINGKSPANLPASEDNELDTFGGGKGLSSANFSTLSAGRGGPSVIFPSIGNKPVSLNSTFTFDYGKNLQFGLSGFSCAELLKKGVDESGVYYLQISGAHYWYLKVYCDMDTANGGWTVIQRRDDYGLPRENFNRSWTEYKYGFGEPDREFWLGNENIYLLVASDDYTLRIEMEDFDGNRRYAEYETFSLASEREQYRLRIGGYQGNAGDSLNDPWYGSNLRPFSTFDRDNDRSSLNCASMLKGGWWWKSCGRSLNGLYLNQPQDLNARQGIVWFRWRGWDYSLKRTRMMIRPKSFLA